MARSDITRRKFLQRVTAMAVGGVAGAAINGQGGDDPPPVQQAPSINPTPEEQRRQAWTAANPPKTMKEKMLTGAAVGATAGVGLHMATQVNIRQSAESGATQNDPQRVEWERYQQRERDRQERERNRDREI